MTQSLSDYFHFFIRWLSNPREIASIVPSSKKLASALVKHTTAPIPSHPTLLNYLNSDASQLIFYPETDIVIELGPGTGAVTQALLKNNTPIAHLFIIEKDPTMALHMQKKFPHLLIYTADACELKQLLSQQNIKKVKRVISSLPLLAMPNKIRRMILYQLVCVLEEGGAFFQYTYGAQCPIPLEELTFFGLTATPIEKVWFNIPPARIWRIQKIKTQLNLEVHSFESAYLENAFQSFELLQYCKES
ncbi:MAG: rRNA adenine N-6-methyltransferase family protein [Pseudomonadota bacterium]